MRLKLNLNASDVEQGSVRRGVNEKIQVAPLRIAAIKNRPEYARIAGPMGKNDLAD